MIVLARTRVVGTTGNDGFQTDFSLDELFIGLAGRDTFRIAWLEEEDRFKGGFGWDSMTMEFHRWADGGNDLLETAIWFDGGRGRDSFEYRIIYEPGDHTIELSSLGGTLKSVENIDYFLTDSQSFGSASVDAKIKTTGTDRNDDIFVAFTKDYDSLRLEVDAGAGRDRLGANAFGEATTTVILRGGNGNDIIYNSIGIRDGDARIAHYGQNGNDRLAGQSWGTDLYGGKGRDVIVVQGGRTTEPEVGPGIVKGGKGADTFVLFGSTSANAIGANIRDFSGNDKLAIADTWGITRENIDLSGADDDAAMQFDPVTGVFSYFDRPLLQFKPGTVIREDQVAIRDADDFIDIYWY